MAGTDKFEDLKLSDLSLEPLPDPNDEEWFAIQTRSLAEGAAE